MKVYFDNASTTPLLPEVKARMHKIVDSHYGNPSSIHAFGRQSKILVEDARSVIAQGLGASLGEIFFTSGATEANNMALFCAVRDLGVTDLISSPTEHHCILHMLDYLQEQNLAKVHYLKVDSTGNIDYAQLESLCSQLQDKAMVSLMHANNEIGTLHDIYRIGEICLKTKSLFHCDTAQTIAKIPLKVFPGLNFLSGSAHKFFGPKGVGFIYINDDNIIKPYFHGGNQERGMRSGTENIYGIQGMAKAFELALTEIEERKTKVEEIVSYFLKQCLSTFKDVKLNSGDSERLYNILSLSFPGSDRSEMMMMNLDIAGICASAGSACTSGVENVSHVLEAIGHDPTRKTVRFSFSHLNTKDEVDYVVEKLKSITPVHATS